MSVMDWVSRRMFNLVHGKNLVYNTCWEDPRLDRIALDVGPDDEIVMITSAGCNALDYALVNPRHIYAVDLNPRQNALLELKLAGIRRLEFDDFFRMFGHGFHPQIEQHYASVLRPQLTESAQDYWDKRIKRFFGSVKRPFYYRGTAGSFARYVNIYINRIAKLRTHVNQLLEAKTLAEQQEIYNEHIQQRFWTRTMKFAMNRDTTLSMVGVPKAQRRQVESQYDGGIVKFCQDCMEAVFARLPLQDNYFWRVYMTGQYTIDCCPEYLREENFNRLRDGLVDKISVHTNSVQGFLDSHNGPISRFVLLDHMDWLSDQYFHLLEAEWQAIVNRATPNARAIWRSGGLRTDFIERVTVQHQGQSRQLPELLGYHEALADELHEQDRVHTYGSFYVADLAA